MTNIEHFINFVIERENIRTNKEEKRLPKPWTEDKILQEYRFCNINREHDKGTLIIRDTFGSDMKYPLTTFAMGRVINNYEIIPNLLPINSNHDIMINEEWCSKWLENTGNKAYKGDAYVLCPAHGETYHEFVWRIVRTIFEMESNELANPLTLNQIFESLCTIHRLGDFIINQIICDYKYVNILEDFETFIKFGPGTSRGFKIIHDKKINQKRFDDFREQVTIELDKINTQISSNIVDYFDDPNNLTNSLCEYDKYVRIGTPSLRHSCRKRKEKENK